MRAAGLPIVIASRHPDRPESLAKETEAFALDVDATDAGQVERLFVETEVKIGAPEIVIYNPSARARGPVAEIDPKEVEAAVAVTALGAPRRTVKVTNGISSLHGLGCTNCVDALSARTP